MFIPVSFPQLVPCGILDTPAEIGVGGAQRVPLTRITSIDLMARRSLQDDMPGIMLRAAVRATASAMLQYQVQRQAGDKEAGAALGIAAALMTAVVQGADDRTWRMLPGEVSIARVRLPPGMHDVTVRTPLGEQRAQVTVSGRYAVIDFRVLSRQLYVHAPGLKRETLQ
jgi:hypothetical protein